jgi:hypothetical protein
MCKMSLCGLAIFATVWLAAGCSGHSGLKSGGGTAGAGGTTNGPVAGGLGGTTIGAGGVVAGGMGGASGGTSGTSSCIMTECIGPLPCVPASQPRPNLCGCPIPTCEPDAGAGGAISTGGATSAGNCTFVDGGTPPGVDEVTGLSFSAVSTTEFAPPPPVQVMVTDAIKAQDAYQATLALPALQTVTHSCPVDLGVSYQLTFLLANDGTLTVAAYPNGCQFVSIPGTCVRSVDSAYWSQLAKDLGIPESEIYPYSPAMFPPPQPDAGVAGIPDAGSTGCTWQGNLIAVGQQVDAGDGCNTCTCTGVGIVCTMRACPPVDAPMLVCSLTSALTFGSNGGKVFFQDSDTLDTTGHMTVTRNYFGNTDGPNVRTCSPALPDCGAFGVVSISTIAQDLNDADVQFAFKLTTSHVYGVDQRPVDGAVWSITQASGGNILVGAPCPSPVMNSCQPIPAGIQRLTGDLRSLASAAAASPACAGL